MEALKAKVARQLFELGAIKFGEFELKLHETQPDAPKSPIYIDLRTASHPSKPGPLTDEVVERIVGLMIDLLAAEGIRYDCFVGVPEAGEPFVEVLERIVGFNIDHPERLYLKKDQLEDGKRRIGSTVTGKFKAGDRVLVIDDLITQADSKIEAIKALETQGLVVVYVLVLVDRMQGGKEQLEEQGYKLIAVFPLGEMLAFYVDKGYIPLGKSNEVLEYVADNRL